MLAEVHNSVFIVCLDCWFWMFSYLFFIYLYRISKPLHVCKFKVSAMPLQCKVVFKPVCFVLSRKFKTSLLVWWIQVSIMLILAGQCLNYLEMHHKVEVGWIACVRARTHVSMLVLATLELIAFSDSFNFLSFQVTCILSTWWFCWSCQRINLYADIFDNWT